MSKVTTTYRISKPLVCFECKQPFSWEKFYSAGHTFCNINCKDQFDERNETRKRRVA